MRSRVFSLGWRMQYLDSPSNLNMKETNLHHKGHMGKKKIKLN